MILMTELLEDVVQTVEEGKDGKKSLHIEGIFLQGAVTNRNKRYYSMDVLGPEVGRYMNEYVGKGRAYGELGHPQGPQINLERVSHMITNLRQEGNNFIGKARITDTPYGNIAKGLMESGAKLGVSSRGLGSLVEKNGVNEVQKDFRLCTAADIVADPSAPDAYVNGVMEGYEWVYENGLLQQRMAENHRETIQKATRIGLPEAKLAVWTEFLAELKRPNR
jgi:hypothetical protein